VTVRALCDPFRVTSIQVADQGFVAAQPGRVAALVADRCNWRRWFPELALTVREDRGGKGVRWSVAGAVEGTMEVWLEPVLDGVVVHYFLHAEPAAVGGTGMLAAANHARRMDGKTMVFDIKGALEAGRPAGEPPRCGDGGGRPAPPGSGYSSGWARRPEGNPRP